MDYLIGALMALLFTRLFRRRENFLVTAEGNNGKYSYMILKDNDQLLVSFAEKMGEDWELLVRHSIDLTKDKGEADETI